MIRQRAHGVLFRDFTAQTFRRSARACLTDIERFGGFPQFFARRLSRKIV